MSIAGDSARENMAKDLISFINLKKEQNKDKKEVVKILEEIEKEIRDYIPYNF